MCTRKKIRPQSAGFQRDSVFAKRLFVTFRNVRIQKKKKNQTSISAKYRFSGKWERGDPAPSHPELSKLFS